MQTKTQTQILTPRNMVASHQKVVLPLNTSQEAVAWGNTLQIAETPKPKWLEPSRCVRSR